MFRPFPLALFMIAAAAAQNNPRIATSNGDVAVQVAAGKSFSISCPSNGGAVECSGPNVEVVGGECAPRAAFASAADLAATQAATIQAAFDISALNATVAQALNDAAPNPLHSTYIAWYSMSVSSLGLRGGDREVLVYGPGLEVLSNPGYRNLFSLTATSTTDDNQVIIASGSPAEGAGAVTFDFPHWPHDVAEVTLSVTFDADGGLAIPFRGIDGGNVLTVSRWWSDATWRSDNTVVISGISLDDGPNTYQCTYTDRAGRLVLSPSGTDGQRVQDDNTINCGRVPGGLAIETIGGVPTAIATVGLNRRSASGSWEVVTYNTAVADAGANEIAIQTCLDGIRDGDETDTDCGGSCSFCTDIGAGCRADTDCNEGAGHGCRGNRCQLIGYSSCLAAKNAGQTSNGIYPILVSGTIHPTYCDQTYAGGGWTMVMKVTNMDGNIDWRYNRRSTSWTRAAYSNVGASNAASCSGRLGNCGGTDFIHPAYGVMGARNVLLRNALGSVMKSIYTRDAPLGGQTLRSKMTQSNVDGGRACSNDIVYGTGTPKRGAYNSLVFNGDERGDTEPAMIALRCGCACDSETMKLGNGETGGDGSGHKEVYSQGNHWGSQSTFRGMWIFVRE